MGEENFKKMNKAMQAEKIEERNLERKIADLKTKMRGEKKKKSAERRDEPGNAEQPAGKRRKLNKHEYKRVLQEKKEAKKRERMEEEQGEAKEGGKKHSTLYSMFTQKRRKNVAAEVEGKKAEESRWKKAWTHNDQANIA